jgi:hypothetical protein
VFTEGLLCAPHRQRWVRHDNQWLQCSRLRGTGEDHPNGGLRRASNNSEGGWTKSQQQVDWALKAKLEFASQVGSGNEGYSEFLCETRQLVCCHSGWEHRKGRKWKTKKLGLVRDRL